VAANPELTGQVATGSKITADVYKPTGGQ